MTTTEQSEGIILDQLAPTKNSRIDDTFEWSLENKLDHNIVVGAIKSLLVDAYVCTRDLSTSFFVLTAQGTELLSSGSQEMQVLSTLAKDDEGKGLTITELQSKLGKDVCKIGMANCMKTKWATKSGDKIIPIRRLDEVSDEVQAALTTLHQSLGKVDAVDDEVRC